MGIVVLKASNETYSGTTTPQPSPEYLAVAATADERVAALVAALGLALLLMAVWEVGRLTLLVVREFVRGFAVSGVSIFASLVVLAFVVMWAAARG